jgi:7,8-dihydro-6-hydroxymethylpterin-pyrophosphokinase
MTRRRFVLRPLADLLPEFILPGSARPSVREALRALDPSADPDVSETVQRVEPMDDESGWRVGLQ